MVVVFDGNFAMVGKIDDVTIDLMILMQGINSVKCNEPIRYKIISDNVHRLIKDDDKAREIVLEFLENMHDIT